LVSSAALYSAMLRSSAAICSCSRFGGQDAGLAGIAVEERAVDRHQGAAQQIEAAGEQHKNPGSPPSARPRWPCGNWRSWR